MSTIVSNNVQIGQSGTATNNFTLYQPLVADGTVRLANGNTGSTTDLVTVTSAGNVGIGIASPGYKLHVAGSGIYNGPVYANRTENDTNTRWNLHLTRGDGTGGTFYLGTTGNGSNALSSANFGFSTGSQSIIFNIDGSVNLPNGQIKFPTTQNASSDANTLDDYEEGTFTPTISAGGGTITSYSANGKYTKIGRLVTIVVSYTITNNGTGGSYGIIGGFPFTSSGSYTGVDRIGGTTGNTCTGVTSNGGSDVAMWTYSNAYPWATNANGNFTLTYMTT